MTEGGAVVNFAKLRGAHVALQRVAVRARTMAYAKEPHEVIADLMDRAEFLVGLLVEPEDRAVEFREQLESIASRHLVLGAVEAFDGQP